MKVTRFEIEEFSSNGTIAERNAELKFAYYSPMVDNLGPPAQRFDTERITVAVPDLHLPSTAVIIIRLELDPHEAEIEHQLDFVISVNYELQRCGTWVLTPSSTVSDSTNFSEDRLIRESVGEYSFTFEGEGDFVVRLERPVHEVAADKSTNGGPVNNRMETTLATLQINVIAA
jgi:hypothetical protein